MGSWLRVSVDRSAEHLRISDRTVWPCILQRRFAEFFNDAHMDRMSQQALLQQLRYRALKVPQTLSRLYPEFDSFSDIVSRLLKDKSGGYDGLLCEHVLDLSKDALFCLYLVLKKYTFDVFHDVEAWRLGGI